jgi:hypothetical protein
LSEAEMKSYAAIVLLFTGLTAQAQSVHKCTVDGKVSYSDQPCPDHAAARAVLNVQAAPTADPDAIKALRQQKKQADSLEKSRLKQQEKDQREDASAARAAAVQRKRCGKLKLSKQWADEDARRATGAAVEPSRLKAKRAGEAMALECPR